ncbi:MAG TPA: ATP-dependent 6-phosphofructokinase [Planctomycetota bacterium]|nr:ATP-dependent 6-phosphofructokinase [Planctomycetota bacterium]
MKSKTHCIGILTSGGDCPGLNAAIRAVTKAAIHDYGMHVIGILDGFRGLVENRTMNLESALVSGILTHGGTILGTSRDKPKKMRMGDEELDMTATAVKNAERLGIDCLVCLGGGGTQKNALHLHKAGGLNVLTLPKTIDNDVAETDVSFGFDTAMAIATDAIDRLHTTASSHQRVIVCEVMGHNTGWLALGAGTASGADVILIPEIGYDFEVIAKFLTDRRRSGKKFSLIALAEGAHPKGMAPTNGDDASGGDSQDADPKEGSDKAEDKAEKKKRKEEKKKKKKEKEEKEREEEVLHTSWEDIPLVQEPKASRLARHLTRLTGIEARVTSLGHVQRGGIPSPTDRLLCTRLGTKAAELLAQGVYNVMVAAKGDDCVPVPLERVAGVKKTVPLDHPWIISARAVGTCFGDA